MKRKLFLSIGLVSLFVVAGLFFGSQSKVAAASLCGVLAPAVNPPPPNTNCLSGQNYNALTGMSGSSDSLKSQFISRMHGFEAGQEPQQVGAKYIETALCSSGGCMGKTWDQRLMDSDITMDQGAFGYSTNTAYNPATNQVESYPDPGNSTSLLFIQNGVVVYAIKEDCGNPVGSLGGFKIPPEATLDGYKLDNTWSNPDGMAYSGNPVSVGSLTTGTNPFYFDGGSGHAAKIPAGQAFTVSVVDDDAAWNIYGYSICDGTVNTCNQAYFTANFKQGTSFSYTFTAGHDYHMRWLFKPVGNGPSGTLAVACDSLASGHATASFSDPDGPTSAYIKVSGVTYATATSSPYTWSSIPIPASGANSVSLYVKDVGSGTPTAGQYVLMDTQSLSNAKCQPSTGCPSMPNPNTTIVLTNTAPSGGAPAAWGFGGGTEYDPDYRYDLSGRGVFDYSTSWGGSSVPLPYTYSSGSNVVNVNYSNYITDYPYDRNQAAADYVSYYHTRTYSYSGTPVYDDSPVCDTWGYVDSGTGYYQTWTYNYSTGQWVGSNWYEIYNYQCTHTHPLHQLLGYTPVYTGETDNLTASGTAYGTLMQACWSRGFQVTSVSAGNLSYDNQEHPTHVSSGGGSANVNFYYPNATPAWGLRQPMQVGLTYAATYTWDRASGPPELNYNAYGCSPLAGSVTVPGTTSAGSASGPMPSGGCNANAPPLNVGDEICLTYTVTPTGNQMNIAGSITANNGGTMTSPRSCTGPVQNMPFARFYGGDVLAGAQLPGGSCKAGSGIMANRQGNAGSGSQFAALSLSTIQGFASAFLRSAAPTPPTGLSFANNTGGDGGQFGGPCTQMPDYFTADRPTNGVTNTSASAITTSTLTSDGADQAYYDSVGGSTLGGLMVPIGTSVTIFVNGNLYINGDINYTPGWQWDANTRTSDIPSLYVIVKGNIDIASTVRNLDGVFIAQPNGASGGTIRTCSQGINSPYPAGSLYASCSANQLTVNGAFIAQDVLMDRSHQSLRYGSAGENPWTGPQNAAEIFNLSPEVYLSDPNLNPSSGPKQDKYDYITSLSPIL